MTEREDIELLLPWYVTGTLDEDETHRVDAYLAEHRDLDDQLALIREDQDAVIALNEQVPTPAAGGLDKLMARIDAETPAIERHKQSFMEAIKDLFGAYGSPALKLATASLVVLLVAQSVAITSLMTGSDTGSAYQTATGQDGGSGPDLLIEFTQDATIGQIQTVLGEHDATIVGGPLPGGLFEVRLDIEPRSDETIEAAAERLRSRKKVIVQILRSE